MQANEYEKCVGVLNMTVPVIIQHNKPTPSYDTELSSIAKKKCGIESEDVCIINSEQAFINVSSTCIKNSLILRCTRYFEANCWDVLKKIGVPRRQEHNIKKTD